MILRLFYTSVFRLLSKESWLFFERNKFVGVNDTDCREELIELLLIEVFFDELLIVTIIEIENLSVV